MDVLPEFWLGFDASSDHQIACPEIDVVSVHLCGTNEVSACGIFVQATEVNAVERWCVKL